MPTDVERARAFSLVAEEYDRGRPGYAPEAIQWLLGDSVLDVIDLGAGTGKLTEALVEAGHRTIAVEPLAEMRAILEHHHPGLRIVAGTAEETGLPDACADAVVAGSAFHWFDHARAFPEIARLLRGPGVMGVLGNSFDATQRWAARAGEIIDGLGLGRAGHPPTIAELSEHFDSVRDREFVHEETISRERLRDQALSRGAIALLEPEQRQLVLDQLDRLWREEPALAGRDSVAVRYLTRVTRCSGLMREPGRSDADAVGT